MKNKFFTVIYEDNDIIVFNKKSGVLSSPSRYENTGESLQSLACEYGKLMTVHRLDKDTSGVIIYARNPQSHRELSLQFQRGQVKKFYHCLINGRPAWDKITVDKPLLVDSDNRHRTQVKRNGKKACTDFAILCTVGNYTWLLAMPKTGRTHQIRAHLRYLGITIVSDPLYSGNQHGIYLSELKKKYNGDTTLEKPLLSRLALHAYAISILHPTTKEPMTFTASYQKDLEATRRQLSKIYGKDPLESVSYIAQATASVMP